MVGLDADLGVFGSVIHEFSVLATQFRPENISQNSIFIGFLGAALVGSSAWYGRAILKGLYAFIRKLLFDEITLYSDTEALSYLDKYINRTCDLSKRRRVNIVYGSSSEDSYPGLIDSTEDEKKDCPIMFTLASGIHFIRIAGKMCYYSRTIEFDKMGKKKETVHLKALGRGAKEAILDCIASEIKSEKTSDSIKVYTSDGYDYDYVGLSPRRDINKITLPGDVITDIQRDMDTFISRRSWYKDRGITYKRGYLFYGPPGTGKSSLAKALASKYSNNVFLLNMPSLRDDDALSGAFCSAKRRSGDKDLTFIVLEDIDCVSTSISREKTDGERGSISLATLLNVLDGVASQENVVVIMTTNRKKVLDPALIRAGRADKHYLIDLLDRNHVHKYISSFFEKEIPLECIPEINISGSELQGICLESSSVEESIEKIKRYIAR